MEQFQIASHLLSKIGCPTYKLWTTRRAIDCAEDIPRKAMRVLLFRVGRRPSATFRIVQYFRCNRTDKQAAK
jgi:hypothetical protein